jgi:hypothetical protein
MSDEGTCDCGEPNCNGSFGIYAEGTVDTAGTLQLPVGEIRSGMFVNDEENPTGAYGISFNGDRVVWVFNAHTIEMLVEVVADASAKLQGLKEA